MNSIEEKSSNWLSLLSKYLKLASLRPKNGLLLEWFEEFQAQKILYFLYLALKSACFFCILIYFFCIYPVFQELPTHKPVNYLMSGGEMGYLVGSCILIDKGVPLDSFLVAKTLKSS